MAYQQCWPSIYNCQIHFHGRFGSSPNLLGPTPSYSPSSTAVKLGADWSGDKLALAGDARMAASQYSNPKGTGKIWVAQTKKDARIHSPNRLKNSRSRDRTYDWQPKGGNQKVRLPTRRGIDRGRGRVSAWDEHWSRRPVSGKYSQPSQAQISRHRRSEFTKGRSMAVAGRAINYLGFVYMGYQYATAPMEQRSQVLYELSSAHSFSQDLVYGTAEAGRSISQTLVRGLTHLS